MYDHYYKVNSQGFIEKGFTTYFERPTHNDILKGENLGGHFGNDEKFIDNNGYYLYKSVNGKKVPATVQEQIDLKPYDQKRAMDYLPIQEQLDMLYHDMVNGSTNWLDLITLIKQTYPKPA